MGAFGAPAYESMVGSVLDGEASLDQIHSLDDAKNRVAFIDESDC